MKEEKPGGLRGSLGMIGAMGAMAVCCGAPLLIIGLGSIGVGTIMAFISDALLPVGAVLIVGGFGFFKYRSYVKQNRESRDVSSESLTKSQES